MAKLILYPIMSRCEGTAPWALCGRSARVLEHPSMAFTSCEKAMQINDSGSLETADCSGAQLIEPCDRCGQSIKRVKGRFRPESNFEEVKR